METEYGINGITILYGTSHYFINVTRICFQKMQEQPNLIIIPIGDNARAHIFSDPEPYVIKSVFVSVWSKPFVEYSSSTLVRVNILTKQVTTVCLKELHNKVQLIHDFLKLKHGDFMEEYPEQRIVANYLTGNEKVLELGANIGRNTLVIASILITKANTNLVTMECDKETAKQLTENRDINGFTFKIEPSALSTRKLVQHGWSTVEAKETDTLPFVPTITLQQFRKKYPILFDTLVLDCEGSFYSILKDMPSILLNIRLIIMENDYTEIEKKEEVDRILRSFGFYRDYIEEGGWGPCEHFFYEAWKKL